MTARAGAPIASRAVSPTASHRSSPRSRGSATGRGELSAAVAAAMVVGVGGVVLDSPLVVVVGPSVIVAVAVELRRRRRRRHDRAEADGLPVAVDRLIQQLRSGVSLTHACRHLAAPAGRRDRAPGHDPGALAPLVDALAGGDTLGEAAGRLGASADPSVRLVAVTLAVLAGNGGPAVPALVRLRHTLIGRAHRRRRAEAQAAGAVASAGLLALAPALFALILAGVEPDLARFYLRDPLGAGCAGASLALSVAGWWWIDRIVVRARSADR